MALRVIERAWMRGLRAERGSICQHHRHLHMLVAYLALNEALQLTNDSNADLTRERHGDYLWSQLT